MVRLRYAALLGLLALFGAGCAGPSAKVPDLPDEEVKAEQHRQQLTASKSHFAALARLNEVAFRIKVANREYCEYVEPQIGIYAATTHSLPRKFGSAAGEALGVDSTFATVLTLAEGSPAAVAGIKQGDRILTFNNEAVPAKKTSEWMERWLRAHGDAPVTVLVKRGEEERRVTLYPVMTCAIPVVLSSDENTNAFTDYRKIVVHAGILRIAQSDAEVAAVVGHELAHVNMGHYGKRLQNMVLGAVGGAAIDGGLAMGGIYSGGVFRRHLGLAGARMFSVGFEREADYVGAYYAARAGYDISAAARLWRAVAQENPDSLHAAKTHPPTPARFVQMQKTIAEIEDKKRRHVALEPDLKPAQIEPAAAAQY